MSLERVNHEALVLHFYFNLNPLRKVKDLLVCGAGCFADPVLYGGLLIPCA